MSPLDGPDIIGAEPTLVGLYYVGLCYVGLVISFLNLEINLSKSELIFNPELILFITSPSIANK